MKKILLLLLILFTSGVSVSQVNRITDRLHQKMMSVNPLEYTRILIVFSDQVDVETLDKELYKMNASLQYRAETVINTLQQKARQTQGPVLTYLKEEKDNGKVKELMDFWVTNLIYAEVTNDIILELSRKNEIQMIDLDEKITYDKPTYENNNNIGNATESSEPGLNVIKANLLWELGITGAGRTVMHIDTGVDALHPALGPRWGGNNGRQWDHAWYDPVAPFTQTPTDCGTHGTHTMGIMCGMDPATGDTVGVAPDAFWIAAGITDCPGASYPSMNIAAYQWAIDPDSNATTMDMPDAISCSWQDPTVPGVGQCSSIYVSVLNAVEAAGIAVVFSAGNSGSGASSITPPKNINTDSVNTFCVGNVNGNSPPYLISSSSSRGPSICGGVGTLLIKPEVSAPGTSVRSTTPNNTYGLKTGTSMAAPHVAGCIALLKQVAPNLTGKQIKAVLLSTCTDLGDPGEDNAYGKGLVNVYEAFLNLGAFPLNAFNLQTPSTGTRIETLPNSAATVNITWDTAATGAQYKWIFGSPTTTPRKLTIPANTNSLTMTLGELDQMLENAGVAQGDSLVGQWDVWSYRISPVDSLKAANGPRALTLKRAQPLLSTFNLSSPPNNSTVISLVNSPDPVNINWTRSGEAVTYKWFYASPNFSTQADIKFSIQSENNGYDSTLTFSSSKLDSMLGSIGVAVGDSSVGKWKVYGYSAGDSLASNQAFGITLRRGIPPTVTTTLDSIIVSVPFGQSATRNMMIGNTGQFDLNWTISESSSASLNNPGNGHNFTSEQIEQMLNQPKDAADIFNGTEQTDAQGGPDAGGYRWIDSDEPGGPAFNWVEIASTGTAITTWTSGTADDGSVILPLPFTFKYYGNDYTSLKVVTNGWMGFDIASTSNAYLNAAIPVAAEPNNALYPFWDDLDLRTAGTVYYLNDAANNRFIVEYKDVPHYSTGQLYTFQVMLYSDGRIFYQYLSMDPSLINSCTIGTENVGGATGLQVVYNAAYLHNNLAIKIEKGLGWLEEMPNSGTISPGGSQSVDVMFNSTGLATGVYTGVMNVNSNDPNRPVKQIPVKLTVGVVDVQNNNLGVPSEFALNQNYPNPFNPTTKISFAIPQESFVTIKIYDILGKEVSKIVNQTKQAGYYSFNFDASSLSSGMYFYKIEAGNFVQTKRMLLMK